MEENALPTLSKEFYLSKPRLLHWQVLASSTQAKNFTQNSGLRSYRVFTENICCLVLIFIYDSVDQHAF